MRRPWRIWVSSMIGIVVEHLPALLDEVLELLQVRKEGVYVDCTLGLGGHSEQILSRLGGTGQLIALDWDEEALDGCLLDLGVSSLHLDSPERGFSFRQEGPLDMRMDQRTGTTAADLVNQLSEKDLADLFHRYGEEKAARRIAAVLVERRGESPILTTTQLAEMIEEVKGPGRGRIHPATRVFQALRIEVNAELIGLEEMLQEVISLLNPGGRLVVISFHSLEDRIVKNVFRKAAGRCVCFRPQELCSCPKISEVRILTRKPVTPSTREVQENPRSRSAKLRAVEKEN